VAVGVLPAVERAASSATDYVRKVFAEVLRFAEDELDADQTFETFGVDSLISLQIVNRFARDLGDLPATLLFENLTIAELAGYFEREHQDRLPADRVDRPRAASVVAEPAAVLVVAEPAGSAGVAPDAVPDDAIAVIGVSGRYPGAQDVDGFWRLIAAGGTGITEVPADRWDWREHFDTRKGRPQRTNSRWGGFLERVADFDPAFFGILGRDAAAIDPQERLFLETSWNLLEETGYLGEHTRQPQTGIFVGLMYGTYGQLGATLWNQGRLSGAHSAYWSVANRVSYFFDFNGPSFAVDSACSSSLTAVYLACESLRRGECAMAIAGGVSLILHPSHHVSLSSLNMLSSDGLCKPFDERADGFVPGEGVGAVLLKPLRAALADGDDVWAVIRGGAMNAGGKTGGYTVPNPNAQGELIGAALRRAGVEPGAVSFVEAHGTGTELGDPIEVAAMARAFALSDAAPGSCAVSSVKANIGHLEGAAGIAGLTKTLLQLRHAQIAPCANLDRVNPKIALDGTPFWLPRELRPWQSADGGPLRAGVSSFGAGGANVHLVLEQAPVQSVPEPAPSGGDQAFLLSARTPRQLAAYARRLADFLSSPDGAQVSLAALCYTSQVGRRAMAERVAFVAGDVALLRDRLAAFARAFVRDGLRDEADALLDGEGEVKALARQWTRGERVDWRRLWAVPPRRVAYPTYPFERTRHWLSAWHRKRRALDDTTDLFTDHLVRRTPTMPGAALVRMALEAGQALHGPGVEARDVRWPQPLSVLDQAATVDVALGDGDRFRVDGGDDSSPAYAEGVLQPARARRHSFELATVEARCTRRIDVEQFYRTMADAGLAYGPRLRVLTQLTAGDGEVLARLDPGSPTALLDGAMQTLAALDDGNALMLPVRVARIAMAPDTEPAWVHGRVRETGPGRRTFDLTATSRDGRTLLEVEGLEVLAMPNSFGKPSQTTRGSDPSLAPAARAADPISDRPAGTGPVSSVATADPINNQTSGMGPAAGVATANPVGSRAAVAPAGSAAPESPDLTEFHRTLWQPEPLAPGHRLGRVQVEACDPAVKSAIEERVRDLGGTVVVAEPESLIIVADPADSLDVAEQLDAGLRRVLSLTTAALAADRDLHVVFGHDGAPAYEAVSGALASLTLEHSRLRATCVSLPGQDAAATLAAEAAAPALPGLTCTAYPDGRRHRRELAQLVPGPDAPFEPRGTYLITGGAGGLGLTFAEFLARWPIPVVLVGRSELSAEQSARIQAIGPRVEYRRADVSNRTQVRALVRDVRAAHGPIHGVLHAAGVLRDRRAVDKPWSEVEQVIAPKVRGVIALDEATREEPLDVFAAFSSVVGHTGNVGQADYAYANAFLDAFAADRERLRAAGARRGRTVSIGWPLWDGGGMAVDEATRRLFARRWGMVPLRAETGLRAFRQILALSDSQVMVIGRAGGHLAAPRAARPVAPAAIDTALDAAEVVAMAEQRVRRMSAEYLLVDEREVDLHADLMDLGFDSIALTSLVNQVNELYGLDLLPTVLFERPTLAGFAAYLAAEHPAEISNQHSATSSGARQDSESAVPAAEAPAASDTTADDPFPETHPPTKPEPPSPWRDTDVAVIGVAGRFPGSPDLDAFWRHLAAGDDLTTALPEDRIELATDPELAGQRMAALQDVGDFDAAHFSISPREAVLMDPQQRLILESAWRVMEDAGYRPQDLAGTATGLFVGVSTSDYDELLTKHAVPIQAHMATGIAHSVLANRVSHRFDLRGPSEAVDTACSSSLVALHRAIGSLASCECEQAIVGGVNVVLSPDVFQSFLAAGMLSPDGHCKPFDAGANGYVRGEGVGAVLLKPLRRAEADGDRIHAVIRASAVNHGGRTPSLTAPSPEAQAAVLTQAYRRAGVDPRTVTYVEAHGTGTRLGDPIEIEGLKKAFAGLYAEAGVTDPPTPHLAIGAVKANIGHLEAAAGMAGLLKVLLCMRHRALPGNPHLSEPNPYLRLDGTPFRLLQNTEPWLGAADGERTVWRAGVSSFGFGGSNAHVVLEAYQEPEEADDDAGFHVFPLSAPTIESLRAYAGRLAAALVAEPRPDLAKVAYTLQVGRTRYPVCFAPTGSDRTELVTELRSFAAGDLPADESAPPEQQWVTPPGRIPLPGPALNPLRHWFTVPPAASMDEAPVNRRAGRVLLRPTGRSPQPVPTPVAAPAIKPTKPAKPAQQIELAEQAKPARQIKPNSVPVKPIRVPAEPATPRSDAAITARVEPRPSPDPTSPLSNAAASARPEPQPSRAPATPLSNAATSTRPEPQPSPLPTSPRDKLLAGCAYNPVLLPASDVELDLLTDSWAERDHPSMAARAAELTERALGDTEPVESRGAPWLPFKHLEAFWSGRAAEAGLCDAWPGPRLAVPHNGLFPSLLFSLARTGFRPVRLAGKARPASVFGGDIDIEELRTLIEAQQISFLCLEVGANSGGGRPMSLRNLSQVRQTLGPDVPLVLDATRVVENAVLIREHELGQMGRDVWDVVHDILALADAVTLSTSKDFGVDFGGLLATNLPELAEHLSRRIEQSGPALPMISRRTLAVAVNDLDAVGDQVGARVRNTGQLHLRLQGAGVPVVGRPGGHCVLLDVSRVPGYAELTSPVPSFLATLFRETGLRCGPHLQDGDRLVRIAVPVGMTSAELGTVAERIITMLADPPRPLAVVPIDADAPDAGFRPVADDRPAAASRPVAEGRPNTEHQPDPRGEANLAILREAVPDVSHLLIPVGGGEVEAFAAGTGPTVLMMPPFNIGAGSFVHQMRVLSAGHRVVVVHRPGVGRTRVDGGLGLDRVADLHLDVLAALGVTGPVHVVGASFGGLVAQAFALRHRERTASLTLIASSFRFANRAGGVERLERVAAEDLDAAIAGSGSERLRAERYRIIAVLLRSESMDPRTGMRYLDEFGSAPDLRDRLGDIAVPTLILHGRHDTVVPAQTASVLRDLIPDNRFVDLADAGHFPGLTSPETVNAILAGFFAEHRGRL
jgi:acyl transferase domain-containing protein/pimeloyl-ACP methyl ester carboxylesterase/tryptophanase/NAD(P)-dependent dehydrogenase (short-subunit alcohol dehydrogenase family)